MRLDLNADAGESFGAWTSGDDEALFRVVTSVNVACGFHAGDPSVIRRTVRAAATAGVAVGAHPGYPDLQGFGRRAMDIAPAAVEDLVIYQVGALAGIAHAEGTRLTHVKPHGALYNAAARDQALADAIARAVRFVDPSLALVGLAGSELVAAARRARIRPLSEAFADRAYRADGTLAPREMPGAVIHDSALAAARAIRLARDGLVETVDHRPLPVRADTICVHSDTPGACELAVAVRAALEQAGITVAAPYAG